MKNRDSEIKNIKKNKNEAFDYFYDSKGIINNLIFDVQKTLDKNYLIWGPSGTGKTTILNKLEESLLTHYHILRLNFNSKNKKMAFYVLRESLGNWIKDAINYAGKSRLFLMEKIKEDLGDDINNLSEICPQLAEELEILPQKQKISIEEKEASLYIGMLKLFEILMYQRKLIVIIDDMQYMDESTRDLFLYLKNNIPSKNLCFLVSYISDKKPESDFFGYDNCNFINMDFFNKEDIKNFIVDIFGDFNFIDELVEIIYYKTLGNPMKVKIIILYLIDAIEKNGSFNLDFENIRRHQLKDASFFELLYGNMEPEFIEFIKRFAIVGNSISSDNLDYICCEHHEDKNIYDLIVKNIELAIKRKIIIRRGKIISFYHDMLRQIVLNDMSDLERMEITLDLAEKIDEDDDYDKLLDKVFYYMEYYRDCKLVPLYVLEKVIKVGECELRLGAYKEAIIYFEFIRCVLGQTEFTLDDSLLKRFYSGIINSSYYLGDFSLIQEFGLEILNKFEDMTKVAAILIKTLSAYTMEGRYNEGLKFGIRLLESVGMSFDPSKIDYLNSFIEAWLLQNTTEALYKVERITNPQKSFALKVLDQMSALSYFYDLKLWRYIAAKRVEISLKYGVDSVSAYAYSNYGIYLVKQNKHKVGYAFGLAGIAVASEFEDKVQLSKVYLDMGNFISPWVESLRKSQSYNETGYKIASEIAEIQYESYFMKFLVFMSLDYGESLVVIKKKLDELLETCKIFKSRSAYDTLWGVSIIVDSEIEDSTIDEKIEREYVLSTSSYGSYYALCNYYLIKTGFFIRSGFYSEAQVSLQKANEYANSVYATFASSQIDFYNGLLAAFFEDKDILAGVIEKFRSYSDSCSDNFEHKLLFLEAESYRLTNPDDISKCMKYYEMALEKSEERLFYQDKALICDRMASLYKEFDLKKNMYIFADESAKEYLSLGYYRCIHNIESRYVFQVSPKKTKEELDSKLFGGYKATRILKDIVSLSYEYSNINNMSSVSKLLDDFLSIILNYTQSYYGVVFRVIANNKFEQETSCYMGSEDEESFKSEEYVDENLLRRSMLGKDAIKYTYSDSRKKCIKHVMFFDFGGSHKRVLYLVRDGHLSPYSDSDIYVIRLILRHVNKTLENISLFADLNEENMRRKDAEMKLQEKQVELHEVNLKLEKMVNQKTVALRETIKDMEIMQDDLMEAKKISSLSQTVIGVAHEINTPIGNALMSQSLLERKTKEIYEKFNSKTLSRKSFEGYLSLANELNAIIRMNLERTTELIKNFKQIATDNYSEPKRCFEIKQYMESILFTMKTTLKKSNHQIIVDIEETNMNTYPGAISQVVANLINNSLIHGLGNIQNGMIQINGKNNGDTYIISIIDNGVGISKENLNKIFDPFFTTRVGDGGSGLGLNIVRSIVNHTLKGKIICTSVANVETRFDFEIPIDIDTIVDENNVESSNGSL